MAGIIWRLLAGGKGWINQHYYKYKIYQIICYADPPEYTKVRKSTCLVSGRSVESC